MAQIQIRDLDDKLVALLKTRAKNNRRSLHDEVKALLEESVRGGGNDVMRETAAIQSKSWRETLLGQRDAHSFRAWAIGQNKAMNALHVGMLSWAR